MPKLTTYDADLHMHGLFSGATSKKMVLDVIAEQAQLKGLEIVGTSDALHPKWLQQIKDKLEEFDEASYQHPKNTKFIVTVEIEDNHRVHHFILLPGIEAAEQLQDLIHPHSKDIEQDGRPHTNLNGEELAELVTEVNGLIGPSHAFVPWTSIYKEYDSLKQCYGDMLPKIKYLELGLSADTYFADRIEELQDITFLSNSDAHSPWPFRLGREFNRFNIAAPTYGEIVKAIKRENGRKIVLNVGVPPQEGKYHATACVNCHQIFSLADAQKLRWQCSNCGSRLKKGVRDRIGEIAKWNEPHHPPHRPPYLHLIPLAEIITLALDYSGPYVKSVQENWRKLITAFGNEVAVLVDEPIEKVTAVSGEKISSAIQSFREKKIKIVPGGGGKYGTLKLQTKTRTEPRKEYSSPQRSLFDFSKEK